MDRAPRRGERRRIAAAPGLKHRPPRGAEVSVPGSSGSLKRVPPSASRLPAGSSCTGSPSDGLPLDGRRLSPHHQERRSSPARRLCPRVPLPRRPFPPAPRTMPLSPVPRPGDPVPLDDLERAIVACRACPRLVAWREEVARTRRAAFRDETYWGRPVPGFGDPEASLLIVGLAPAAHGANRTGRMFTGDRSGDWLFRALHRAGYANQAASRNREDGLELRGAWLTASLRCAPPGNRPTPAERRSCRPFLEAEFDHLLPRLSVIVALGALAFDHVLRIARDRGLAVPRPKPRFGHGREVALGRGAGSSVLTLLASYHPSQQNTFTGTLTEASFDAIWDRARQLDRGGP